MLLTDEAGIGKTRLAEQVLALADKLGATVLRARCYDAERSLFLQPFAELSFSLAGRHSPTDLVRGATVAWPIWPNWCPS